MTGYKELPPNAGFKKGQSGNPGGKPIGARNKLQGAFLNTLAEDFEKDGKQAIIDMRINEPAQYIRCVASLMPKELEVTKPLDDLTDDELARAIATLKQFFDSEGIGDRGEEEKSE